jgi:hypothetical protein
MRIKLFIFLLCCLPLAACAKKADVHPASPVDFVAMTLGQAAEQAHAELAMLAQLRGQGLQPLLPSPDPTLDRRISISWTGPANGALKEICLQTGYRYQEMGGLSAQGMNVVVHGLNRPAYALIEDIAWQIQPQAVVRVDPVSRVITLANSAKGKD